MTRHIPAAVCFLLLLGIVWTGTAYAGTPDKAVVPAETPDLDLFRTGALDVQVMSGPFLSVQPTHSARPNFDYAMTVARLGYMLDTPRSQGFFRGNDELFLETEGAAIYQGPGTAMGGASILYRRNFVQPHAWLVPYFGLGLGGLYSDIYHNRVQRAVGAPFQFNLQGHIGAHFLLGHSRWSIDVEAAYRHISDASISPRNDGIDAVGGLAGFSRIF